MIENWWGCPEATTAMLGWNIAAEKAEKYSASMKTPYVTRWEKTRVAYGMGDGGDGGTGGGGGGAGGDGGRGGGAGGCGVARMEAYASK